VGAPGSNVRHIRRCCDAPGQAALSLTAACFHAGWYTNAAGLCHQQQPFRRVCRPCVTSVHSGRARACVTQPSNTGPVVRQSLLYPRWQRLVRRDARGAASGDGQVWGAPCRWGCTLVAFRADLLRRRARPALWLPRGSAICLSHASLAAANTSMTCSSRLLKSCIRAAEGNLTVGDINAHCGLPERRVFVTTACVRRARRDGRPIEDVLNFSQFAHG